jgi:hypothetical protein
MKTTRIKAETIAEARVKVAQIAARKTGFGIFQVAHDDGCPAIASGRDADCCAPCKPWFFLIEPFADGRNN